MKHFSTFYPFRLFQLAWMKRKAPRRILHLYWMQHKAKNPTLVQYVKTYNNFFFEELGVNRMQCEARHDEIMAKIGIKVTANESFHRLAFATLQISGFLPTNILELGTMKGNTSLFLAELFPDAMIYTIELPLSDPLFFRYHRNTLEYEKFIEERISRPNITLVRLNTAFILERELPNFDLIWLDAGHHYPEVAWDHFYCIHKLRPGGWLFSDDVYMPKYRPKQDIYQVIEYYNQRCQDSFRFLLKRESAFDFIRWPKYIGFLRKTSDAM